MGVSERFSHLFNDYEEDSYRADLERDHQERAMHREFVTRPGYIDFKRWLDEIEDEYHPKPGDQSTVNYGLGLIQGLRLVKRELLRRERMSVEDIDE